MKKEKSEMWGCAMASSPHIIPLRVKAKSLVVRGEKKGKQRSPETARISFRITHSRIQFENQHVPNANSITVVSKTAKQGRF
jgi:hypothetical protein